MARSSTREFVRRVGSPPDERAPAPTSLNRLRDANFPLVADELASVEDRRRKLLGVLDAQRWHWSFERER